MAERGKINAFSRVLNQKVKTRFFMDNLNMTAWNKSPRIDMSPHSDTLSWFRANQSLIFHLNAAYIAEKQQILILKSLVWLDRASNPRSTTLEKSTLTITSRIIYVLNIWFYLCNDSFICTYNHRYVLTGPYDTPLFF
jgi:hypothetical protein